MQSNYYKIFMHANFYVKGTGRWLSTYHKLITRNVSNFAVCSYSRFVSIIYQIYSNVNLT